MYNFILKIVKIPRPLWQKRLVIKIENISKTLIIISSIIISILIVTVLTFTLGNLSLAQKEKQNTEYIIKQAQNNKKFESFNRENLYGTDIISIANLIKDYNTKNDNQYKDMEMLLTINNEIENAIFFKKGRYNLDDIIQYTKKLQEQESDELLNFKTKKFKCTEVLYDGNRIYKMQFQD